MNHEKILKVYDVVTDANNLKSGRFRMLLETDKPISDYAQVLQIINDYPQQQGWLCYQSEVVQIKGGDVLPQREDKILYGELVNKNESLHIQQNGATWWVTRILEDEGDECLIKEHTYCVSETVTASYHVYWKYREHGYQPDSYRFVGFSSEMGE